MDFGEMLAYPVKTIVLHRHAHNDELLGSYILQTFGGVSVFPGIDTARMEFWDSVPHGETWETLLRNKQTLLVGMGFSPFDEHLPGGKRKEDHCAATLVAEALDLREDESLKPLLDYTLQLDSDVGSNAFELPAIIKALWASGKYGRETEKVVIACAYTVYEAIYNRGMEFIRATTDYRKARQHSLNGAFGKEVLFVYGHSDSGEFGKLARHEGAGVVLWMNKSGNVVLQTNHYLRIELAPVVRALRIAEIHEQYRVKPQCAPPPLLPEKALSEGTIDECPAWFFHAKGRFILNGSDTHAVPRTLLSLERIANIVQAVITTDKKVRPVYHKPHRPQEQNAIAADVVLV